MRAIIAIDPGSSGGIVYHDTYTTEAYPMPDTMGDVCELLRELKVKGLTSEGTTPGSVIAYIEAVGGFMGGGKGEKNKAAAHTMFNFGKGVGIIEGCLYTLSVPIEKVTPARWQAELHIQKKKTDSKTEWKNRLKAKAQELFPHTSQKITLKTSDALLICYYAIKQENK